MSKKNNSKRAAYQKKQEEQGKRIVNYIFGGLLILAIIYCIYIFSLM